ncbi:hypothetical protein CB1_001350003 [Camelus ferus]|nr:hypothetical protein CB1_001350003 [Camelus ferus]
MKLSLGLLEELLSLRHAHKFTHIYGPELSHILAFSIPRQAPCLLGYSTVCETLRPVHEHPAPVQLNTRILPDIQDEDIRDHAPTQQSAMQLPVTRNMRLRSDVGGEISCQGREPTNNHLTSGPDGDSQGDKFRGHIPRNASQLLGERRASPQQRGHGAPPALDADDPSALSESSAGTTDCFGLERSGGNMAVSCQVLYDFTCLLKNFGLYLLCAVMRMAGVILNAMWKTLLRLIRDHRGVSTWFSSKRLGLTWHLGPLRSWEVDVGAAGFLNGQAWCWTRTISATACGYCSQRCPGSGGPQGQASLAGVLRKARFLVYL